MDEAGAGDSKSDVARVAEEVTGLDVLDRDGGTTGALVTGGTWEGNARGEDVLHETAAVPSVRAGSTEDVSLTDLSTSTADEGAGVTRLGLVLVEVFEVFIEDLVELFDPLGAAKGHGGGEGGKERNKCDKEEEARHGYVSVREEGGRWGGRGRKGLGEGK